LLSVLDFEARAFVTPARFPAFACIQAQGDTTYAILKLEVDCRSGLFSKGDLPMTTVDTNTVCTGKTNVLIQHNVSAVGRYYTTFHPSYRILRPEAEDIIAAGLKLFVVFEDCPNPVLDKKHGGIDAKRAMQQADKLGQPEGSAIYFAVEGLPDGYAARDVANAKNYFSGIADAVNGRFAVGVYSNGVICRALLKANLCSYAWLSASTAFEGSVDFYNSGKWALAQKQIDLDWQGLSIDTDEANADFGAFSNLLAV
jgi:hypothetical protein